MSIDDDIRERRKAGASYRDIAADLGVSVGYAHKIVHIQVGTVDHARQRVLAALDEYEAAIRAEKP